ncbi:MAG: ABC transporter [Burkholderiaceae bacterium]|nr:ABC transporter [Burkholderiaceae bacterium]
MRDLVRQGKTVVSVLHELPLALQSDDLLIMAAGRITHHGACGDPATHRALEAVFDERIHIQQVAGQWLSLPKL